MRKFFGVSLAICLLFLCLISSVQAADVSLGNAILIHVEDKEVLDGDIITSQEAGKYLRSRLAYDPFLFGVVTMNPAVYLYDKAEKDAVPAISFGKAYVRVSSEKGNLKRGDAITSSANPGVGIKATTNGFIIGIAQEDYSSNDPKATGKILVSVDPRFAQLNNNLVSTLFSFPRLSLSAPLLSPINALRYFIALLIAGASMFFGFRFFGFASIKGVEAIGRNPLAKKTILFTVILNACITVGVMFFGFVIAYLVLVL